MKEIITALNQFQKQMTGLEENAKGNRGNYADIGDVINAAKEAATFGLSWWQGVTQADGGQVLRTIIFHTSGEQMPPSDWPLAVDDWTNSQKVGSASTYARRYGLNAALGLAVGVTDDDGEANGKLKDPPKKTKPATIGVDDVLPSSTATAGQDALSDVRSPSSGEASAFPSPKIKTVTDAGKEKSAAQKYLDSLSAKLSSAANHDEVVQIISKAVSAAKTLEGVEQMFRHLQPSSEQIIKLFADKKLKLVNQLAKEQT